jgi:LPXTG-motif cell wall-anchored protein
MLNFVKRYSLLALVAIFAFSFLPSVTSATVVKQDVVVKVLGEANVLNVVKVGGKCDKIYVKVRTKELNKIVDVSKLKVTVKYDIYHDVKLDALKGKVVANGEVNTKQKGDFYEVVYDPTANPNGPAGNYALKLYLTIGKHKSKIPVIVRVKINEPCKGDNNGGANNGGANNGGTDNGGTNAGNGGTDNGGANAGNGGTDNGGANAGNGGTNNGGANAGNGGTDNGGANAGNGSANAGTNAGTNAGNAGKNPNGGKLPKTANNFASSVAVGAALALAGVAVLAYRRRETN